MTHRPRLHAHRARLARPVALMAIGALALVACGGGAEGNAEGGSEARTLVIARDMDLTTLDPGRGYCDTCQIYMTAVYDTLVSVDAEDPTVTIPRLATEWEVSADSKTYTFQLDPDAVFADGSAVEAKDVKWSFERLGGLKGSAAFFMDGVAAVDTPDDKTVVVRFSEPRSNFLSSVAATNMSVINSDVAAAAGATSGADADKTDKSEEWFLSNSAGSGPYVLESYASGGDVKLKRNDAFWRDEPSAPSIILKQVADSVSQVQQLQQGEVDIAMQVNFDNLGQLKGDDKVQADILPGFTQVYLTLSPGAPAAGAANLKDPRVREAIRKAIDYDEIIANTVAGNGETQASPIPNGFPGTDALPKPERDVDGAKQLLQDAGKASGFSITATYPKLNVYGVDFDVMMQTVERNLAEVSIDLKLNAVDFSQYATQARTGALPVAASYFSPDNADPIPYVQYFGAVEGSVWGARAGGGKAGTPVINAEEQALLEQVLAAPADQQEKLFESLGKEMIEDSIILPILNPKEVRAYASDITGMHRSIVANLDVSLLSFK